MGNQTPTYSWCASYNRTQGRVASALSDAYALPPHPWQRTVLNDWLAIDDDGHLLNSTCILPCPRQNGKALALDTEIPTPDGWRRMEDIHVGDYVFGQDGKPSRVTLESEVFHKPIYRVTFDDGATVDASEDHVWTVQTKETKRRPSAKCHDDGWYEATTAELVEKCRFIRKDGRVEYRYRIPMNDAVEYPERDLPIHPYLLGAWLGDGTSKNGHITISESEIDEFVPLLEECGYRLTRNATRNRAPDFSIGRYEFIHELRRLNLIRNKHIPDEYMTASVEQRWELLRGLMDTDGFCSKAGQCEFVQKRRDLCEQVTELCASLGIKARLHEKQARCNGKPAGTVYRVMFFTTRDRSCFKLRRKHDRLKESIAHRTTYKVIASIERIPNVPSKCIAIDNDSHLYLAGRRYTATHNTGVCDPRETWGLIVRGESILHTAQEYQTSLKAFDRLRAKFGKRKNDEEAEFPELNEMVEKYTTSANQMVLDLTNGGHIEFRTRGNSDDVARGGTFDLLVIDEAQSYTAAQDAALSPLNSAAPLGSPQTILMGTVPNPEKPHKGEVFANLRRSAHEAPYEGMCIHEWGADEVGDPLDRDRWYRYNPSLGYQLLISAFEKDSRGMTPDAFAREHLGWWPELIGEDRLVSEKAWKRCQTDCPPKRGVICYGVKFSPDGAEVALSVALRPNEGVPHVEVVKVERMDGGLQWLVDWLTQRVGKASQIVIDGQSNAQELNDRLTLARVPKRVIVRPTAAEVGGACGAFVTAINEGNVTHFGQDVLTLSVTKCSKRKIGSRGAYGFGGSREVDATPAESVALAYWQAVTTRRKATETRKAKLW